MGGGQHAQGADPGDREERSAVPVFVGDIFAAAGVPSAPVDDASEDRTRPNLKIQDGCNNRCTFCIIPFVRGPQPQRAAGRVVEQVRELAGATARWC